MADEGDVKLLGMSVSPFVVRVRMALRVKGVSYEYVEQDLFNKSQLLLESNPVHKKVPVLLHGGRPICESLAIVQYVDEVWGGAADGDDTVDTGHSILPADPYERATARFWAAYVDEKFVPAWIGIMLAETEEGRAEKVDAAVAVVTQLEQAFAECSNGKPFFAGDSFGYLDLAVGCNLFWLEALRKMLGVAVIDAGKTPLLAAWAESFGEIDAVKEAVPTADAAVAYAEKIQAHRAAAAAAE